MDTSGKQGMLVPQLIYLMSDAAPWLVGILSVCALAAMQSTGAAYMSTAGGMLTRDIVKRFIMPNANHTIQKILGRTGVGIIVLAALRLLRIMMQDLVCWHQLDHLLEQELLLHVLQLLMNLMELTRLLLMLIGIPLDQHGLIEHLGFYR